MPGTDPAQALSVILGELPELPHLPELPDRGPGSDLIGRTAGILVDLPAEATATGWRLAARPGHDLSRAAGMLRGDLDALGEAASGYDGCFKIQFCGPWTLAAMLELTRSVEPALSDAGAVADLIASLAEGVAAHVAAVRELLPAATILAQCDEPALPGVLAGSVPTASGLFRLPAIDAAVAADGLRQVLDAAGTSTLVHCCAPAVPIRCIAQTGADAIAMDLSLIRNQDYDDIGEAVESGMGFFAGAVPAGPAWALPSDGGEPSAGRAASSSGSAHGAAGGAARADVEVARSVAGLWRRIGLRDAALPGQVVVTPACGLAGATVPGARAALARCRTAARLIPEVMEEGTG